MSMSNATENDVLKAVLQGTDIAWRGNANLYIALFTQDPGETGSLTYEADYTSYARVAMPKATGWTDAGGTFSNSGVIQFPKSTGGNVTVTHFAVMTTATAGQIVFKGVLNSPLIVTNGIQPQFSAAAIAISLD